jgi:hypothetical protein
MAVISPHRYKVGDRVKFKLGTHDVVATVTEDRGFIGYQGEQLVRVATPDGSAFDGEFEMLASLMSPARN